MDKQFQEFIDEQLKTVLNDDLIKDETKYAKHFRKVLDQLA